MFLCAWVVVGFFTAQISMSFLWQAFFRPQNDEILAQLVVTALSYTLAAGVIIGVSQLIEPASRQKLRYLLGVHRIMNFKDILYGFLGYGGYFMTTIAVSLLVQALWKDFPIDQMQQVGFNNLSLPIEYVYAFLALVIIAPIFEELIFRGYLFGHIRKKFSFWVTATLVSFIFAAIHVQLNVAVDVFMLSLVLCYIREHTGAIWGSVVLHMIKNAIAFYLLFMRPDLLQMIR